MRNKSDPLSIMKAVFFCISLSLIIMNPDYIGADESADLYSSSDYVLRLNSTTFIPTVFHQNKNITYMVQFYNTYCGHCQMFAPIYKELASRLQNWTSVVRLAGVDCSKDANVITCSENKIDGYPTILIFPPNPRVQEPKDAPTNLRKLNIEWNVDDIEEGIVDYLMNLTKTDREIPLVIDALKPLNISHISEFKRLYPSDTNHDETINERHGKQDLMFIIEPESSYLGRKLIIEYYRINSKLELRRVLLNNRAFIKSILSKEELAKLEKSQPILVKINSNIDSNGQVLVRGELNQVLLSSSEAERLDFIHNRFKLFFEHYFSVELKENGPNLHDSVHNLTILKLPTDVEEPTEERNQELEIQYLIHNDPIGSKRIFAIDILKGISYMITHEIKIKGDLNPSEFNTIRNLLTIIIKYLPIDKWDTKMKKFLDNFRTNLDKNRDKYERIGISGRDIVDILDISGGEGIRLRYERERFVTCHDSDRQHKGYTCSLWLIFHSLTVGEYNRAAPIQTKPSLVLSTMRDYIIRFLGCTVCSSNFEKETEHLLDSLTSRNSSVLWLWGTHNRVNERLNNERRIGRKRLSQVIFPSKDSCPSCLRTDISKLELDGKTLVDIDWNMDSVFKFLIDHYQPKLIMTNRELASLLAKIGGKMRYEFADNRVDLDRGPIIVSDVNRSAEQWKIHDIFSTGDISLCLFLYLACIIMVAVVCVAINPQWKRYKAK